MSQQPPSQPEIPAELWMLWTPQASDWLYESEPDANGFPSAWVVFTSDRDATQYAKQLREDCDIIATAVRVK